MSASPTGRVSIPARIIHRFPPIEAAEWRSLDNNTKARLGKERFLELPNTADVSGDRVRQWLAGHGIEAGRSEWVEVTILPDLPPRYANVAYSFRCVDAFIVGRGGVLDGCELKVSGDNGISGLTISEERLLNAGLLRVYAVNPVLGLLGEIDGEVLLQVPRRLDGIPVGEARVEWVDSNSRGSATRRRTRTGPGSMTDSRSLTPSVSSATIRTTRTPSPITITGSTPLWRHLLEGFDYSSRPDGSVHTIHSGGTTIAEVCVGSTSRTRLNFKEKVVGQPADIAVVLSGRSTRWLGQGVVVTQENLADCRRLLDYVANVARRLS